MRVCANVFKHPGSNAPILHSPHTPHLQRLVEVGLLLEEACLKGGLKWLLQLCGAGPLARMLYINKGLRTR